MRKFHGKGMIAVGLAAVLVSGSIVPTGATSDMEDEKESIQQQIDENQQQQEEKEDELEQVQSQINELENQIQDYNDTLGTLSADINDLNQKMDDKQAEINEIQADYDEQYEMMKLRIQYMYENGNTQMLDLFFSSTSFADFLNKAQYFNDIVEYDRNMLDKMEATRVSLVNAKKELQGQKDTLVTKQEEVRSNLAYISDLKKEQDSLYTQLSDEMADLQAQAYELDGDMSALDAEIQAYLDDLERQRQAEEERRRQEEIRRQEEEERRQQEEEQNNSSPENGGSGGSESGGSTSSYGWVWPAPGCYQLNDYFGYRPDPPSYHHGIDLETGYGHEYVAVADGVVVVAGYDSSLGYYVMVDHGGICSVYAHSSEMYVSSGQYVTQGQVLGLTGNSGWSFGAHLHFAVMVNGSYVDPLPYLN